MGYFSTTPGTEIGDLASKVLIAFQEKQQRTRQESKESK